MDSIGLLVRNLNAEFLLTVSILLSTNDITTYLLNSHHNLNSVQAVQTEVIREVRDAANL